MTYRFLLVLVLVPMMVLTSLAQQPVRPPPTPPASQPSPAPQKPEPDDEVVRITTNLVQVDAVVTDKNGKQVTDLQPEEIEMLEDGKPQRVTNFSYILTTAGEPAAPRIKLPVANKNAPPVAPVPPVRLRPDQVRRTVALVVDDLSMAPENVYYVRRALKKFVDEQMEPNDLVAIIRTGGGMGALQQFTTDKRLLYAAIEKIKWLPARTSIGAFAPIPTDPLEIAQDPALALPKPADADRNRSQDIDKLREDLFTVGTLGALNFIIRGLKDLPGRKSVLVVSEGFLAIDPADLSHVSRIGNAMTRLTDLASRASVVIYALDPRGLQTLNLTAADSGGGLMPHEIGPILSSMRGSAFETSHAFDDLVEQTGGFAIANNNDLSGGMRKVMEDQRGYYLIGYRPDESTFDTSGRRKFHKFSLLIKRPGKFHVRIRSGFFGIPDIETPTAETPRDRLIGALTSPFGSAGVELRLTSLFFSDPKLGLSMRSLLHIKASDLTFTEQPGDWHQSVINMIAMTFGDNGLVVDQLSLTHTLRLKGAAYKRALIDGLTYSINVPIKRPGAYQLRTALRDVDSDRVGSASQFVEVPDVKKKRLVLSGLLLRAESPRAGSGGPNPPPQQGQNVSEQLEDSDPLAAMARRQFQPGTVMSYGLGIYNAQVDKATGKPNLLIQTRLFKEGKLVYAGQQIAFDPGNQVDLKRLEAGGAIQLGTQMAPGEYVLQVIVTDPLAKSKDSLATQWIDFEITK
jgi:VWFA-related protein